MEVLHFPTQNQQALAGATKQGFHALNSLPGYHGGCLDFFLRHEIQQWNINHTRKGIDQGCDEESVPELFV